MVRRRLLLAAGAVLALAPAAARAQLIAGAAPLVSPGGQAPVMVTTDRVTDISLGAPRTILSWTSFNLSADQTVVYRFQDRGGIVLNRVSGQAAIDGQIEALVGAQRNSGNVWFAAPGGVIFGPNAKVSVGGLLATAGAVSQAGFLDPSNLRFTITGAGPSEVRVRAGAEVTGGGGALALISGAVATEPGAKITGKGAVLYGAAGDVTVRFGPLAGDLDLLDFVVPGGGGTTSATPLSLAADTVGARVMLALVNRADVASAVIRAPGLLAAQSASADKGDIVLTAGVDIVDRQPGTARTNSVTETTANFGIVTAQRDVLGAFSAPTAIVASQLAAGRDLGLSAASLDVGGLNAGRLLVVDAGRGITLNGTASAGGAATLRTGGALTIGAGSGDLAAGGRLQLDVGSLAARRLLSGRSVVINASGTSANNGPAVNLASVVAADDIVITATHAAGGIVLGSATITGAGSDEAPTGRTLSLTARGAQGDVTYGAAATGTAIDGATRVLFSAGRDVTANVAGKLNLAGGSAGRNFIIRANDLDLTGALTVANLRVESLGGGLSLGSPPPSAVVRAPLGAPGASPLSVSNAEFQFITATGEVGFYAGSALAPDRGDLTVLDLTVNTGRVPRLLLAAGGANDILVTGTLAPESGGGVLTIGESDPQSPWRPGRILVTGRIGFSTGSPAAGFADLRPFDEVNLNALRDVILGSSRFVALVAATPPGDIDISGNRPAGVAPTADERDRVFLTSANLSLSASERIVQQNTGSRAQPNGILITSQLSNARSLAVTPARVVDLFGAFRDGRGVITGGFQPTIRAGGATSPVIRFNGCAVADGGCAVLASTRKAQQIEDFDLTDPSLTDGLFTLPPEPPVLVLAEPESDAIVTDPVMLGTGSDELWRQSRRPEAAGAPRR